MTTPTIRQRAINRAAADGRRVSAVGTTTTRTLEAVARAHDGRCVSGGGSTDLFMDERKSSAELAKHLGNAVRLRPPSEFVPALDALKGKTVAADPMTAAVAIFDRLKKAGARVRTAADSGMRSTG